MPKKRNVYKGKKLGTGPGSVPGPVPKKNRTRLNSFGFLKRFIFSYFLKILYTDWILLCVPQ